MTNSNKTQVTITRAQRAALACRIGGGFVDDSKLFAAWLFGDQ